MIDDYEPTVPPDDVIEKTIYLGYRTTLEMMGVNPDNAVSEHVIADFRAWVAKKIADSPEGRFVAKFGAEWDLIEDTGGYDQFADDVGCALDEIRSKK